jgi:hypothetical protein
MFGVCCIYSSTVRGMDEVAMLLFNIMSQFEMATTDIVYLLYFAVISRKWLWKHTVLLATCGDELSHKSMLEWFSEEKSHV